MPELIVDNIHLKYGAVEVLKGASFSIEKGQIAALLGPSGSGKTTLLRTVAGLERAYRGRVSVSGKEVFHGEGGLDLPAEKRGLGFVFQSYALWPNRTVFDNVAYGLRLRKAPEAQVRRKVGEVLEVLGLGHLHARFPSQLSGGHDQIEALAIADTIVLLNGGVIAQEGSPEDLYSRPRTLFTADFIGSNARLTGRVTEARDGFAVLDCDGLTVTGRMGHEVRRGDEATAICRLERLSLGSPGEPDCIEMDRATTMFLGEKWENVYRTGPHSLRVLTDGPVPEGRALVRIPRDSVWVF